MKKIKGSVSGIFPDTVFVIFAVAALIAVPVRVFQLGGMIDVETGFYTDKASMTIPLLYAVLAAAAVIILLLSFLSGQMPETKAPKTPSKGIAVSSVLLAVGLLSAFVQNILKIKNQNAVMYSDSSTRLVVIALECVFSVLGSAYFFIHAYSYIKRGIAYRKAGLLSCTVPAWLMCRLVERFSRSISFINNSEVLLEIGEILFFMIFFLELSRIITKTESEGKLRTLLPTGFIGSLFALCTSVPRIAVKVTGGTTVARSPLEICDFFMVIFAVVYIVIALGSANNEKKQVPEFEIPVTGADTLTPEEEALVAEAGSRAEIEKVQKEIRDEEAFRIAAEFADKSVDELASEYTE